MASNSTLVWPPARTPSLFEEYPKLGFLYPFQWERDWHVTWQTDFCKETIREAFYICAVYLIVCFSVRQLMRNRPAFNLKKPLAVWNLFLTTFSTIGTIRTMPFLINTIARRGIYHSVCAPPLEHYGHGPVSLWVTLFIFSKVPELVDTLFIVLRKKPLIFLHWYHHISVLLFCWHAFGTLSASGLYFVVMNFAVHALMYFYYFLTAIGIHPRWARLVTVLQLSQMFVGVIVCCLNVMYIREGLPCSVDRQNLKWGIIMYLSYFALFLQFFIKRYFIKPKKLANKKKTA